MKFTINVDCTPEEARTFLGLPDVQPVQQAVMEHLRDRMMAAIDDASPENLMKTWMPFSGPLGGAAGAGGPGMGDRGAGGGMANPLEELQKAFFSQMAGMAGNAGKPQDKDD